jgi:hypothetical protein
VEDPVDFDPDDPDPVVPDFCPRDVEAVKRVSITTRQ